MRRADGWERLSPAERLALLPPDQLKIVLGAMDDAKAIEVERNWYVWQRPDQAVPGHAWRTWLVMAGRGYGKTRMGAEWVRAIAEQGRPFRIALVGATQAEARAVMVEGESGLLAICPPPPDGPQWEPSLRRLTWPGGAQATLYSAAEADALRGPQHHFAWADEIAKWAGGEAAWDNLMLGLRLGRMPQVVATTTPRPVALVRRLATDAGVALTRGRTRDNRTHLARSFIADVVAAYGDTRLGRQELNGELIDEAEGALWRRDDIERSRVKAAPAGLVRVVVGVDPPAGTSGDACGIVVCGLDGDDHGHVLEDASVTACAPEAWARAVAQAAARHRAERVVAEANNGGALVESVLHAADARLPVTTVMATRGKAARAEPVSLLYARGHVHHVGAMPALEDEMCGLLAGGGYEGPGRSPDRADALVWALTALMLMPKTADPKVRAILPGRPQAGFRDGL